MTILSTGSLCVRLRSAPHATAVRVTFASDFEPVGASLPYPEVTAAAPSPPSTISLYTLVAQLRAQAARTTTVPTTSTTRPAARLAGAPTTTTTGQPPVTAATKAAPAPTTTTTPLTPLTTLLEQLAPVAAAVVPPAHTDTGQASWFNAPDRTCAHRDAPMGTIIKVTRTSNGVSTTCKVNDRGPTVATGRIIDLSLDTFEKLAAREAGLVSVKIEW